MKIIFYCLLLIPIALFAQRNKDYAKNNPTNWGHGTVYFTDGQELKCDLRLLVSFNEGSLQLRKDGAEKTFSPLNITRFVYYDSTFNYTREFRSVNTKFRNRPGNKNCFQEILYEGSEYKLYRRFLPVAKLGALMVPNVGWAIWSYGEVQPSLFLSQNDGLAYEVSFGKNDLNQRFELEKMRYNLDERTLKWILQEDWKKVKKYSKENKLDLSSELGLTEAIKFLENSQFKYDRKSTPKRLRK